MIQTTEDKLIDKLNSFLLAHGIDPLYFATVVAIIAALSCYKDLKNWENIEPWRKWIVVSILFGAIVFSFLSILLLLGIL